MGMLQDLTKQETIEGFFNDCQNMEENANTEVVALQLSALTSSGMIMSSVCAVSGDINVLQDWKNNTDGNDSFSTFYVYNQGLAYLKELNKRQNHEQ